jgi:hypothetical protein
LQQFIDYREGGCDSFSQTAVIVFAVHEDPLLDRFGRSIVGRSKSLDSRSIVNRNNSKVSQNLQKSPQKPFLQSFFYLAVPFSLKRISSCPKVKSSSFQNESRPYRSYSKSQRTAPSAHKIFEYAEIKIKYSVSFVSV